MKYHFTILTQNYSTYFLSLSDKEIDTGHRFQGRLTWCDVTFILPTRLIGILHICRRSFQCLIEKVSLSSRGNAEQGRKAVKAPNCSHHHEAHRRKKGLLPPSKQMRRSHAFLLFSLLRLRQARLHIAALLLEGKARVNFNCQKLKLRHRHAIIWPHFRQEIQFQSAHIIKIG